MAIADRNVRILDSTGNPIKSTNPFPVNVTQNVDINWPTALTTLFSRVRVATDETQVSFRQDTPLKSLVLTEGQVSGSGTSSNFTNATSTTEASTLMTVGTAIGLRRLRTRNAGLYIAGNGLLFLFTFSFERTGQANVVKRAGYFDPSDGIFLEQVNGVLSWVIRSSVSGSIVETRRVAKGAWNTDNFDGTGSGYNFNQSQAHIGWIALEWLGVGDVWCGFINNTVPTLAHTFTNPNLFNKPYIRTANLFPCYEIERTVAGGTAEDFRAICATLKSEGSDGKQGTTQSIRLGAARTTGNTGGVLTPLITFRLQSAWLNSRVAIQGFSLNVTDNAVTNSEIFIVKNPTFSAAYTFVGTALSNSSVEFQNNTGTVIPTTLTITNQEQIILVSTSAAIANAPFASNVNASNSINFMGSNFSTTADIYCLCIRPDTASVTIASALITLWEQL